MNILPIILARGGSKGLPRKNILPLNGKPMIAYTIEATKRVLGFVIVSTDNQEIYDISKQYGAESWIRQPELATDTAKSIDVVNALLVNFKDIGAVCLLNACCPLTIAEDIAGAVKLFKETGADSVVSLVKDFSSHPTKVCCLIDDNKLAPMTVFETGERQKLPDIYKRNTAIYIAKREVIESGTFFGPDTRGYVMPKSRSYDINDKIDFDICEFLIKQRDEKR